MTTFVRYDDEVDVTSLVSGTTWQTIDLAGYIVDPTAIGVIMRVTDANAATQNGMAEVGDGGPTYPVAKLLAGFYGTQAISLGVGTSIDVQLGTATTKLFISGEIHGPDAVLYEHAVQWDLVDAEHGAWQPRQPTPQGADVMSDISAVIVRRASAFNNTVGLRELASTDPESQLRWEIALVWDVVGVDDDGYYEIYSTGKAGADTEDCQFFEIGYIKNTSNVVTILNPQDEGLSGQPTIFGTLDLSATVPADTVMAGGRIFETEGGAPSKVKVGYIRNSGSNESTGLKINRGSFQTQHFALDSSLQAEYRFQNAFVQFWLTWYETAPVVTAIPGIGTANAFVGSSAKAFTYAGPAVDVGAGLSSAADATPHAGPATDAGTALRASSRSATHIGPAGDEE